MVLSLLIALITFVPIIAIAGISSIGEQVIGKEGTMTNVANATFWSAYLAFGPITITLIFVGGGFVLLILFFIVSIQIFKEPNKNLKPTS